MDEMKGDTMDGPREEVSFSYSFDVEERHHVLRVNFDIPLKKSVEELACRLISSHSIPCYMRDNLINSLNGFVKQKTKEFQSKIRNELFKNFNQSGEKDRLSQLWCNRLSKSQMLKHNSNLSYDTAWSDIYHKLIHSPALEALLQLEHSYAMAMKDVVTKRDKGLKELQEKHLVEMELTVEKVGVTKSNSDVNNLAANQLEESQMMETYWSSALSDLQETQKREYRQWVVTVYEKTIGDESFSGISPGYNRSASLDSYQVVNDADLPPEKLLEESFTIHLGTQMKTMHNIRLVCRDMLNYCQCRVSYVGGNMVPHPQRLQTAMSLYSQSLSALFLLVDDHIDGLNGIKRNFVKICNESTEFHFPNYEQQICVIEQTLQERSKKKRTLRTGSFGENPDAQVKKTTNLLQTGDFYITKHSNLAEVHAVFHLVTDETVTNSNINSRHPIMIGIRNIMLAASRHNITNIIIPLLLVHEMVENLTLQWCMKRAELVLKCVKGFMMESLSWDGHESRTLQFVVPPGISEETFIAFSNMLPSIFRVSNPLDLSNLSVKLN